MIINRACNQKLLKYYAGGYYVETLKQSAKVTRLMLTTKFNNGPLTSMHRDIKIRHAIFSTTI